VSSGLLPYDCQFSAAYNCAGFQFSISADAPGIAAHFPGRPIIAAYMQLLWLEAAVEHTFPGRRISTVQNVKFKSSILPSCEVEIVLRWTDAQLPEAGEGEIAFEIFSAGRPATHGKLSLVCAHVD
jgi:hypothetical protein